MDKQIAAKIGIVVMLAGLMGCSAKPPPPEIQTPPTPVVQVIQPPGVVEYVWEEPMIDVVDVPPGLDPEGTYYRQGHQAIYEVRQGRWQYYRKPQDRIE